MTTNVNTHCFGESMRRQETIPSSPVITSVGQDVDATGSGQSFEQFDIPAQPGRCTLHQTTNTQFSDLLKEGENLCINCIRIILSRGDLISSNKIDEKMLMRENTS
jgi:hypothetical protein